MNNVIEIIKMLRKESVLNIDQNNNNRYRVVVKEKDGTKTAYYFAVPIYNNETNEMVSLSFKHTPKGYIAVGSSSLISIAQMVRIETKDGFCQMPLIDTLMEDAIEQLKYKDVTLYPTTNGVAYKSKPKGTGTYSFELECSIPFLNVKANAKSFSLLRERHQPFVTVSCIGSVDEKGNVVAPAKLTYSKINDRKYKISISSSENSLGALFEINMYESKLIQDTTVESNNPNDNNAFGSVAFLGNTFELGEQWLYSRFDLSNITGWLDKKILQANWYIPKYNSVNIDVSAYRVISHFCSFGSNWDNKVGFSYKIGDIVNDKEYAILNITKMFKEFQNQIGVRPHGFVLKPKNKNNNGCNIVSTADSYYMPQVFSIHYE